jgi:hypothetical protein
MTLTLPVVAQVPGLLLANYVTIHTTSEDPHLVDNSASALTQVSFQTTLPYITR